MVGRFVAPATLMGSAAPSSSMKVRVHDLSASRTGTNAVLSTSATLAARDTDGKRWACLQRPEDLCFVPHPPLSITALSATAWPRRRKPPPTNLSVPPHWHRKWALAPLLYDCLMFAEHGITTTALETSTPLARTRRTSFPRRHPRQRVHQTPPSHQELLAVGPVRLAGQAHFSHLRY